MTEAQLALFMTVLVIWVLLAFGIFPWLQGERLRFDFLLIGFGVLIVLLLLSLFTAPSFTLWLEYTAVALLILLALWAYDRWAMKTQEE